MRRAAQERVMLRPAAADTGVHAGFSPRGTRLGWRHPGARGLLRDLRGAQLRSGGTAAAPKAESARPVEQAGSKSPAGQDDEGRAGQQQVRQGRVPLRRAHVRAQAGRAGPAARRRARGGREAHRGPLLPPARLRRRRRRRARRGRRSRSRTWPSSAPPSRVSRDYRAVTDQLVISQAPAVVIVGRNARRGWSRASSTRRRWRRKSRTRDEPGDRRGRAASASRHGSWPRRPRLRHPTTTANGLTPPSAAAAARASSPT